MAVLRKTSFCHWGAFEAVIKDDRLISAQPINGSGADAGMIAAWPALVHSPLRIDRPHVRRGFLDRGFGSGQGRGREEMVPVSWDVALDLVAAELRRVYDSHGPKSVFGGSYGWSSAGRFHHARTQIRRFLAAAGGFTDQTGNYSWGAAHAILPHVLGSAGAVSGAATGWQSMAEHCDVLVAFGGLNPKNWRVTSGGARDHHMPEMLAHAVSRGMQVIVISPNGDDCPPALGATLVRPRPNSDTAIMLALAHEALTTGRADMDFLERFTDGHEKFCNYLIGQDDGIAKTLEWASGISGLPLGDLRALWQSISTGRVMLSASWSLQRADHGEQTYWALIALAAMLGQIGLPGGGFSFGYGSLNAVGAAARKGFVPAMPGLANPYGGSIPAAMFVDAFMNPGAQRPFNTGTITYPDVRLVYWAGGNPFHHAQDLFKLTQAWRRPETVIVHEPWWTATALHADIVLPATTSAERNDIGGTSRDPHVTAMPRLISPVDLARDDFTIFGDLAERLGCRHSFDLGRSEQDWLRILWAETQTRGQKSFIEVPDFDSFWNAGSWAVPPPEDAEVLLQDFRANPDTHALATPSGRIQLYSPPIAKLGLTDCLGHPAWFEPSEWLGNAASDELHLLTNQPPQQLHSQLFQTRTETGPTEVAINPKDAMIRGLHTGQIARLWNHRGACLGTVRLDPGLLIGVLVMPTGAWFAPDQQGLEQNGNPNVLTADRQTSALGQACAAQSTLVRIGPYEKDLKKEEHHGHGN
jgi:biotin/methionine sulfoxide reductase